jgi:hypothetical protein
MLERHFLCSDEGLATLVEGCSVQVEEDRVAWLSPDGRRRAEAEVVLVARWSVTDGVVRYPKKWPTEPTPAASPADAIAAAHRFAAGRGMCTHGVLGAPGLTEWRFWGVYDVEPEADLGTDPPG